MIEGTDRVYDEQERKAIATFTTFICFALAVHLYLTHPRVAAALMLAAGLGQASYWCGRQVENRLP